MNTDKPPLGLKPKFIHDHERSQDIMDACLRYIRSGKLPKEEWIVELADIHNNRELK